MTTNTDVAMPELPAACPFCDHSMMHMRSVGKMQQAHCSGCGAAGPLFTDAGPAIAAWNSRAAIQQAAGSVPEGLADLLQSCRGSIKADLWRYEQMLLVQQVPHLHAVVKSEIDRLRALLDSIDALATFPPKQQPVHLGGGEGGGVPLTGTQIEAAARDAQSAFCLNKFGSYEHAFARAIEAAHGIKEAS